MVKSEEKTVLAFPTYTKLEGIRGKSFLLATQRKRIDRSRHFKKRIEKRRRRYNPRSSKPKSKIGLAKAQARRCNKKQERNIEKNKFRKKILFVISFRRRHNAELSSCWYSFLSFVFLYGITSHLVRYLRCLGLVDSSHDERA